MSGLGRGIKFKNVGYARCYVCSNWR